MNKCTCGAKKCGHPVHSDWCDTNNCASNYRKSIVSDTKEQFKVGDWAQYVSTMGYDCVANTKENHVGKGYVCGCQEGDSCADCVLEV